MTRTELAAKAGVTKGAITQAIDAGRIGLTPDNQVDSESPLTISFLIEPRRQRTQVQKLSTPTSPLKPAKPAPKSPTIGAKPHKTPPPAPTAQPFHREPGMEIEPSRGSWKRDTGEGESYNEAERRKMIAAADLGEIKAKEAAGQLVPRDEVQRVFFQMQAVDSSQIIPIGQRTAAEIAAVFGIDDGTKILQAQEIIDIETRSALAQAKKLMDDWLKENEEV